VTRAPFDKLRAGFGIEIGARLVRSSAFGVGAVVALLAIDDAPTVWASRYDAVLRAGSRVLRFTAGDHGLLPSPYTAAGWRPRIVRLGDERGRLRRIQQAGNGGSGHGAV